MVEKDARFADMWLTVGLQPKGTLRSAQHDKNVGRMLLLVAEGFDGVKF